MLHDFTFHLALVDEEFMAESSVGEKLFPEEFDVFPVEKIALLSRQKILRGREMIRLPSPPVAAIPRHAKDIQTLGQPCRKSKRRSRSA